MNFTEIVSICIAHNLPFFGYRMPKNQEITIGIQTSPSIIKNIDILSENEGFVAVPFQKSGSLDSYFIRADISVTNGDITSNDLHTIQSTVFPKKELHDSTVEITKAEYLMQASTLIEKLRNEELQKVVLSRAIHLNTLSLREGVSIFEKLTQTYPHAFVSFFHIPGIAAWIGASPETLLKSHNNHIETMSLAGTKPSTGNTPWTEKEREEQQMVSNYVADVLDKLPFEQIIVDGPKDLLAGNVCHLMTNYICNGKLTSNQLSTLIDGLHPTPAVCGLPKAESMQLIGETELHDREFYAGYIGSVSKGSCDLFVNLRCMKLSDHGITLYVGGGLTAQSNAEAEWQETCLKAETLLKIIKN